MFFKYLCLSGGGATGFALLGFIKRLEDANVLRCIDTVYGCSIGALIGFLFTLGLSADEMFSRFLNLSHNINQYKNIEEFFQCLGLDSGEYLLAYIIDILIEHNVNPIITFKQLFQKYGKKLVLVGTNISKHTTVYLSMDEHPDMRVIDAVRISISLPLLFTPIKLKNDYYVDGGLMDNYPMEKALQDFQERFPNLHPTNCVIGCDLQNLIPIVTDNMYSYAYNMYASILKRKSQTYCTVTISPVSINSIDFSIGVDTRKELFQNGFEETDKYMNKLGISSFRTQRRMSC